MSAPYIVRPTEPGMALVVDRETGEQVGWVVQTFYGWDGFVLGVGAPVASERYRGEAAGAVWSKARDERNRWFKAAR